MKLAIKPVRELGNYHWQGFIEASYPKSRGVVTLVWADKSEERVEQRTASLSDVLEKLGAESPPSPHKLWHALSRGHINVSVNIKDAH